MPVPITGESGGGAVLVMGVFEHMFNIVLKSGGEVFCDFLSVAGEEANFGIIYAAVSSVSIVGGIVIAEFEITDSFSDISPNACAVDIEVRENRLSGRSVLASGAFPVSPVSIEGEFVIVNVFIEADSDFVITEPAVRFTCTLDGIFASYSAQVGVEV